MSHITEVVGMEGDIITLQDIFRFNYPSDDPRSRPEFDLDSSTNSQSETLRSPRLFPVARCQGDERRPTRLADRGGRADRRACPVGPHNRPQIHPEVILAIDTSESMDPAIAAAKAAANDFVSFDAGRRCESVSRRSPTTWSC